MFTGHMVGTDRTDSIHQRKAGFNLGHMDSRNFVFYMDGIGFCFGTQFCDSSYKSISQSVADSPAVHNLLY